MGKWRTFQGRTLAELLCAMGVASILVATVVPSLMGIVVRGQQRAILSDVFSDLALARTESVRRGQRVVMCKSADQTHCLHDEAWNVGWIVFVDANNDAQHSDSETLLHVRERVSDRWRLVGNGSMARYVSYHPNGRTRLLNGGFQAGTLRLCDLRHTVAGDARVIISAAGRPRVEKSAEASCE